MQGRVDRVWRNERADGSEYWVLSVDGERYSTWDKDVIANVHEGDLVEFAFARSGRFRNLTALRKLTGPMPAGSSSPAPTARAQRRIRLHCLRTAAGMLKDATLLPEQKVSLVMAIAGQLEQHVLTVPADQQQECTPHGEASQSELNPTEGERAR